MRRSKLNLVDLAGSERVSKTGADGDTLMQAKYINLSLHYLEQVCGREGPGVWNMRTCWLSKRLICRYSTHGMRVYFCLRQV